MYENLVKRLRNRANGSYEEKCDGCEFTEDFPPCVHCTIKAFNDAADAIEKMDKRIDFLMNCIYEAEDSLDRGADNDWARAALEKAERGQDDV